MDLIYRYPGITPFSQNDRQVFFGREADIERLYHSILLNQCTVIVGRSGVGKTSLIYAGLIPRILESINNNQHDDRHFLFFPIRVGVHTKEQITTPVENIKEAIAAALPESSNLNFLSHLPEEIKQTVWYQLKLLQCSEAAKQNLNLFFIFDQLEEFFTYPADQFKAFLQIFREVTTTNLPDDVREKIEDLQSSGSLTLTAADLQLLYAKIPVKLLLAIRADKMSLLNRLRDAIPSIFQNPIELNPFNRRQALKAIIQPARTPQPTSNDFKYLTDPFEIEEETAEKICNYLQSQPSNDLEALEDYRIEPFILQLICQHIERNVLPKDADRKISAVELEQPEEIITKYYQDTLGGLRLPTEKLLPVRLLLEDKMIYEPDKRRLTLYKEIITKEHGIEEKILDQLVKSKLLRELAGAAGKSSYEISHDWMVQPILNAKKERLILNPAQGVNNAIAGLELELKKDFDNHLLHKRIGNYYYFLKDYGSAIPYFTQAIELIEKKSLARDVELYYNRGDAYGLSGDFAAANADFSEVLALDPNRLLAVYYKGYYLHKLKDYQAAAGYYEKVIELDSTYSLAHYNLGVVYEILERYEESSQSYQQAVALNQKDFEAHYRLGLVLIHLKDFDNAIKNLQAALHLNPSFIDAHIQLAYVSFYYLDKRKEGFDYIREQAQNHPNVAALWKTLAMFFKEMKQVNEATRSFYKAIELAPNDADSYYRLCQLFNDALKYKDAITAAESCLQLLPDHVNALVEKGYAHQMLQDMKKAKACYEEALILDPKNEPAANNLKLIYQSGEKAEEYLNILKDNPGNTVALLNLGILHNNQGNHQQAIETLNRLIAIDAANTPALLELAYAYYQVKEVEQAIRSYQRIMEVDPTNSSAYWSLGKVYEGLGKREEAKQQYSLATDLDPADHESFYRLGIMANDERNYTKAVENFDKVLAIKPDHKNALIEKAFALYYLGKFSEARTCYNNIILFEPGNAKAEFGLGLTCKQLGEVSEAISHYKKAIELVATYADAHYNLALIYHEQQAFKEAIHHFSIVVGLEPERPDAYIYLGFYSIEAKDFTSAQEYYQKLLQLEPEKEDWQYNLGLALAGQNKLQEAESTFISVTKKNPADKGAWLQLATVYEKLKQPEKAAYCLTRAEEIKDN